MIDVRTGYLIVSLLYVVMPAAAWMVLSGQRSRPVAWWCGGGIVFGLGVLLLSQRGLIDDHLSIDVANLLVFAGILIRGQALRMDLRMTWRSWQLLGLFLLPSAIFVWLHDGLQDPFWRVQFSSVVQSLMYLALARLAWLLGRQLNSRSARWIAAVYVILGLAMLNRALMVWHGDVNADPLLGQGIGLTLIPIAGVFAAIISHVGYVGMVLDHSQQQKLDVATAVARAEAQQVLLDQLAMLDRRRSLGELSAGLGHELNQPLTAMLTNAQVAQRGLSSGRLQTAQLVDLLHKVEQNCQRAEDIIDKLRISSESAAVPHSAIDLAQIVQQGVELMSPEMQRHGVRCFVSGQDRSLPVSGDATQLSQVIVNVLRNAIESLQQVERREIHIEFRLETGRVRLAISDTGAGLSADAAQRVGSAFFSTKPDGLGMGLAISRGIAAQHNGALTLSPVGGGGACAELDLPLLPEETTAPKA